MRQPRHPQGFFDQAGLRTLSRRWVGSCLTALACVAGPASAQSWEPAGNKTLTLHTRDGQSMALGKVIFTAHPQTARSYTFKLDIDHTKVRDHFLSMREFKCIEGGPELLCHVPYPYPNPATITLDGQGGGDFRWLEHALLFLYKNPRDFGAKLWNGVYYPLNLGANGLQGRAQAVDLNQISAPPDKPEVPPFKPALRDDLPENARWINRISID